MSAVMRSPHASGLIKPCSITVLNITLLLRLLIFCVAVGYRFAGDNALGGDERLKKPKLKVATLPPRRTGIAQFCLKNAGIPLSLLYSSV